MSNGDSWWQYPSTNPYPIYQIYQQPLYYTWPIYTVPPAICKWFDG